MSEPKLLTLAEMAELLGIRASTLRHYVRIGKVRVYKLGRNVQRFDLKEVRADMRIMRENEKIQY
jgi:excisionase family DNA binding protein